MSKYFVVFFLILAFVSFGDAYISITDTGVALKTLPYAGSYKVFAIGAKDTYEFFNGLVFVGYDASYLSPIDAYREVFPYFPLGYASYDFFVGVKNERFSITAFHNCTHQFNSSSMELPWTDGSYNSLIFEIIF